MEATLTVIIATTASKERSESLVRAIDSIRDQNVPCTIIVVVNGGMAVSKTVSMLEQAVDVDLLTLSEPNLVKALTAGVERVRTDYFAFLDDDDVYNPGTFQKCVQYMESHADKDALVVWGQKSYADGRVERIPERFDASDPLASLFDCAWLASCGGIYRRDSVTADYFASMPRYTEWTYLAYRLIREKNVNFLMGDKKAHFTLFESPGSEMQSIEYVIATPDNIRLMMAPDLPVKIKHLLADKLARALHDAAATCMDSGRIKDAWRFHLASLRETKGLRYLLFSRYLVVATMRLKRPTFT